MMQHRSADALSEVWYTRCPVPTPLGLAAQLGWLDDTFAREGIALRSIIDSPNRDIRRNHFSHGLDWSFRQGGNIPPIRARSEGRQTRLVGITWTDEFQAIIALPGTGITRIGHLKGRRFGIARRPAGIVDFMAATALKGLRSALSLGGLTADDVEVVDIALDASILETQEGSSLFGLKRKQPFGEEMAALIRGEVDAIYVKGTAGLSVANLIGAVAVCEFGFHPDARIRVNSGSPRILTVDARLAEERPDLVTLLLETVQRAGAWAEAHPDDTRRFVAREAAATEEQVLAAHGPDVHHHLGIGLQSELIDAVEHYKNFLLAEGFLAGDFDLRSWVDPRPLEATRLSAAAAQGF
jgi:ABC-type nitrate/sulfonate/bicarbonate transport system substrate-binding protein